jgi:hypothetical protein
MVLIISLFIISVYPESQKADTMANQDDKRTAELIQAMRKLTDSSRKLLQASAELIEASEIVIRTTEEAFRPQMRSTSSTAGCPSVH